MSFNAESGNSADTLIFPRKRPGRFWPDLSDGYRSNTIIWGLLTRPALIQFNIARFAVLALGQSDREYPVLILGLDLLGINFLGK